MNDYTSFFASIQNMLCMVHLTVVLMWWFGRYESVAVSTMHVVVFNSTGGQSAKLNQMHVSCQI